MKKGVELIAQERHEQIHKHGYDVRNDRWYSKEELLKAALFCIDQTRFEFPREWDDHSREKIVNKSRVEQLTVAGAFIAAEIDRINYNQNPKEERYQKTLNELRYYSSGEYEKTNDSNRFSIDVGGSVMIGVEIKDGKPIIYGAVNGYGQAIPLDKVRISEDVEY